MTDLLQSIGYWVHGLGILGYPVAVLLMAGVALLPIPAEIPAAMNGMLFGTVVGTAITWSGGMLGAWASFELSRRFGRPLAARVLPNRALGEVDGLVKAASWPGLLVARLIPAVAFTALNWGLGLTLCRRSTFLWTTAVGVLPGTVLFVSSGHGLARLYAANPELAVGLVVLIGLMVVYIGRRRRRVRPPDVPSG